MDNFLWQAPLFTFCWPCIMLRFSVNDQRDAQFFTMYLFLFLTLYMFRAHRAYHQERQIVSNCVKNKNKYILRTVCHVGHLPRSTTLSCLGWGCLKFGLWSHDPHMGFMLCGRITLKWICKKWDLKLWAGFIWLRIGTSDFSCEDEWNFGFLWKQGIFCPVDDLASYDSSLWNEAVG
jgi:hypothetical protein